MATISPACMSVGARSNGEIDGEGRVGVLFCWATHVNDAKVLRYNHDLAERDLAARAGVGPLS